MSLKKYLKRGSLTGQAILEYFLLLLAIVSLTLLSVTKFLPEVQQKGETFFQKASARIMGE